jgi:LPXTG-motif cell wall-anchored protein
MPRRRFIVALLALALLLPSSAFGQAAGDDQYQDPFGDEPAQSDQQPNSRAAAQDDGGLTDEPPVGDDEPEAPAPPPEEPADEPAEQPKALPNTGADPRVLAFVGVLFVLIGAGLRLRTIDPDAY